MPFTNAKIAARQQNTMDKKAKTPGLPPGTPIHHGERRAESVRVKLIDYTEAHFTELAISDINNLAAYRQSESVSWIIVEGLHDVEKIGGIGNIFDLHSLIIEDVLHPQQRTKMEDYEQYIYVVFQVFSFDDPLRGESAANRLEQVSVILGSHFLLTFHEHSCDIFNPVLERLQTMRGRLRKMNESYLFYALIDMIVDKYWVHVCDIGDDIDAVEDDVLNNNIEVSLNQIHGIKKHVIQLYRPIAALQRVCEQVTHDGSAFFDQSVNVYFRDVHDHTHRALDALERHRELLTSLLEIQMTLSSARMNEVMKTLTVISTVFIPLTFIAGIYGMNFNTDRGMWNMPELNWPFGYPFALGLMLIFALAMIVFFRRKKWL